LDIADPPTQSAHEGEGAAELAALLDAVLADPAIEGQAAALADEIRARMPFAAGEEEGLFGEPLSALLAEARAVALARTSDGTPE